MKKTGLAFGFIFMAVFTVFGQQKIKLRLAPRLGSAVFALNQAVAAGSYDYKITRLEFYVSEIKITHDGGQITATDTSLHLLVRPANDSLYDLGQFSNISTVEAITFSVGVDKANNHLDPAKWPADNPLAPQNPDMNWGWTTGYRFVAIEGDAGAGFANHFEVHALGDANYKTLTLAVGAEQIDAQTKEIRLVADYSQVLNAIDVSNGPAIHSTTGKAVVLLNNMRDLVFKAATSATQNLSFDGQFQLSANPARVDDELEVSMTLPTGFAYRLTATDLLGRVVVNEPILAENTSFSLKNRLKKGIFIVHLFQNERPVASEKWVIF